MVWDILRATQFHGFALFLLQSLTAGDGTLTVPSGIRLQPVAADEVAERLVRIATGPPGRTITLFGGPQMLDLEEMARAYQQARGATGPVQTDPVGNPMLGAMLDAWRSGDQVTPEHAEDTLTWQQFLRARYPG